MKKAILFLMIFVFLFTGCNCKSGLDAEKPDVTFDNKITDEPEITQSVLPEQFDPVTELSIYQRAYSKEEKYYNLKNWQDYIKEKLDIDVYVFNALKELRGAQAVYYFNYRIGFPYVNSNSIFDYMDPEKAYDLTPYYDKYSWGNYVDESYIQELSSNGRIFAIPTYPNKYIIPRYYNASFLNQLNMDVPTDINSFHNYLIESKKIMTGDGLHLPMFIPDRYQFPCLADIFRAYGVYVNSEYQSAISYNPHTNSYEDAVFSENIFEILDFIKNLQTQELLGIFGEYNIYSSGSIGDNQFIGDRSKVNKTFATEFYMVFNTDINYFRRFLLTKPEYEAKNGYYLSHLNTEKICEVRSDMGFYVFPKNIENIHGTVDLFNSLMTDKDMYADLLYGVQNTDYEIHNDVIYPKLPDLGTFKGIHLIVPYEDHNSYYKPDNINIADQLASNMLYESNIFNQVFSGRYRFIVGNGLSSGSYHFNLFAKDFSIADAIEGYKEYFIGSGMYQAIIDVNEKIGTVPAYNYIP